MKKRNRIIVTTMISVVVYILFSIVLFMIETGSSELKSIWDSLWFILTAFFAIGYGDISFLSTAGRIIGFVFVFLGVCFLGLIIGNITNVITERFEKRKLGFMGTKFKDHIIILGWDKFSEDVAVQLVGADKKVAIMTDDKDSIDLIYQRFGNDDVFVCFSEINKYSSLELLNIKQSKAIFLNNGDDTDKLVSILNIKKTYPDAYFIVILENQDLTDTFVTAGVTYVLSKNEIASKMVASYIFEPAVADFTRDLLASTDSEFEYDIQQYKVIEGNPFAQKRYGDMFSELKKEYNIIAIGLNKNTEDEKYLIKAPKDDEIITVGDDVIVIANGATEKIMQRVFKVLEGA